MPLLVAICTTPWPRPYSALWLLVATRTSCRLSLLGRTVAFPCRAHHAEAVQLDAIGKRRAAVDVDGRREAPPVETDTEGLRSLTLAHFHAAGHACLDRSVVQRILIDVRNGIDHAVADGALHRTGIGLQLLREAETCSCVDILESSN